MASSRASIETIARHLMISGRVQGVGYRHHMTMQARALSLTGWCRNLPDGRVEAWVQGPRHRVEQLIEWAQKGPEAAIVEDVAVEDQAVLDALPGETIELFETRT